MLKTLLLLSLAMMAAADLRPASQPKNDFKVLTRNNPIGFTTLKYAMYMEPSDFNYQGLKNQRNGAYDNFLRSNIDNEQDKRNFNNEAGRDHLPFRSYEGAATDASNTVKYKLPKLPIPSAADISRPRKAPQPVGCFKDNTQNRDLNKQRVDLGRPSTALDPVSECARKCLGYKYMGLQYSRQCFCGDSDTRKHGPAQNCDMKCSTDPSVICGGSNANSVFKLDPPPGAAPGMVIAAPDARQTIPLRWNNPHASELEVNVWLMKTDSPTPIVVPVRKPTCSGEGYQDQVVSFKIPADFNNLAAKVPGFKGCKAVGDCVVQMYAHSVEARTYSHGTPLIVHGFTGTGPKATNNNQIKQPAADVAWDLPKLPRDICLSSADPSADIASAQPQFARLVSDVFNHAYQNSDYSAYSGQQADQISRNLQASAIISQVPANRGELGKSILDGRSRGILAKTRGISNNIIKKYEGFANTIIKAIQNDVATTGTVEGQPLAKCFRCLETGSLSTRRLTTNTYVPSFQIPANLLDKAKARVPTQYQNLISADGKLKIYETTFNDMKVKYEELKTLGFHYQPAVKKTTPTTMPDTVQFKKRTKAGTTDGGKFAAETAQKFKADVALPSVKRATTYVGCYRDASNRDLNVKREDFPTMAEDPVQYCALLCEKYQYMGIQDGRQCFCSNSATRKYDTETDCQPCAGAPTQGCGGPWRNSVYSLQGTSALDSPMLDTIEGFDQPTMSDPDGEYHDTNCDDDGKFRWNMTCNKPKIMYLPSEDGNLVVYNPQADAAPAGTAGTVTPTTSSPSVITIIAITAACILIPQFIIGVAIFVWRKNSDEQGDYQLQMS